MKRCAVFQFRLQLQRNLTKFMFARMERLPSAIYDMKRYSALTATALNSVRPVLNLSSAALACCVLFLCCRSNEVLRRTYGKDNRVLHTAKLSQGFKVVSPAERGKVLAFPLAVRKS